MKILILHQPFPMGNYRLMPYIGKTLQDLGHEVVVAEQLNGALWTVEALKVIQVENFDAAYFEMLDGQTFELMEKSGIPKKILCYASKGIFKTFEEIVEYKDRYYTGVLTNSKEMSEVFSENGISNEFFEYYPAPIFEEEVTKSINYKLPIVYLGGGFQRLTKPEYSKESELIYTNPAVSIFGNGWPSTPNYKGILPPEDIGRLYHSAEVCIGTIEPSQRAKGMVNNRYSEMFKAGATIASVNYPEIDFYGGEQFIQFVNTREELAQVKTLSEEKKKAQKEFIEKKEKAFFNSLEKLLFL